MGICISSVSSFDEEAQNTDKNLAFSDEKLYNDSVPGLASLFSLQGKKGPNQDSAILCQVLCFYNSSIYENYALHMIKALNMLVALRDLENKMEYFVGCSMGTAGMGV